MPAWDSAGKNRWVRDTDDRHLLLRQGSRLVEHHLSTVQVYDAAKPMDDVNPLGGATHVATHNRADLADADADALWLAMGAGEYTKPST